ncbi:MAG: hypothetical protein R6U17_00470 [Thermoplasmata archaeon]
MDIDDIIGILKGYHFEVITEDDAFQALEGVPALDLYLAEIELMAHGLREEDIKEIGKLYAKLLQERDNGHDQFCSRRHRRRW